MPDPSRIEEILLRIVASDDDADQKLSAVERRLRALNDQRAKARVEIDDAASSRIEEIRAELKRLGEQVARPSVHLDDIAARARIGELERELRRVSGTRHVRVDVSGGSGGLSAGLDRIKSDLSEIGQRAQSLPRWIAATLPLTIPLVGTLAQAAAGAGLLGVAAGGAAVAFGALGMAAKMGLGSQAQLTQAVSAQKSAQTELTAAVKSGDQARIAAARNQLAQAQDDVRSAEQQQAAWQTTTNAVKNGWQNVQQAFMAAAGPGARTMLAGLVTSMRTVTSALGGTKGAFSVLGAAVRDALASPQTQDGIRQLIAGFSGLVRASAPLAGPIVQGLLALGRIFVNLATAAMPELVKLVTQLSDWLGNIANKTQDQERLRATVDRLMRSFEAVWGVVVKIAVALGQLFNSQIARSALAIISVFAQLVGWVIQLTNHLGPLGQLIGAGLGIVLIIGKFSAWTQALRDTLGVLGTLRKALFGVAEAEVAVDAAQGAGGGGGGLVGWLKSKLGRSAAKDAEEVAVGGGGAGLAGWLKGLLGKLGGGLAGGGLMGVLRGGLGGLLARVGIGAGAEGALGAGALGGPIGLALAAVGTGMVVAIAKWHAPIGRAISSVWSSVVATTRASAARITTAAGVAWRGIAAAGQAVAGAAGSTARAVWSRVQSATRAAAGSISAAARGAWNQIATAARAVGGAVGSAASAVMRAGEAAVAGAAGLVHSAASLVWHGLSSAARAVGAAVSSAASATMHAGASAVSATAGLVRNAAGMVWHGITSALAAITGAVQGAARAVIGAAGSAISGASRFVSGAASSVAHSIISAFDSVIGQAAHAGASIMNAVASGISSAAGSVYSAGKSVAHFLAGLWPGSEPRDPSSPLRGLAHRGQAIMQNLAAGVTAAPLHAALKRALGESITALAVHTVRGATPMVALPSAGLGNVTLPITTAAGQQATAGTGALVVHQHLEFKMLAAPDAAGKRVIAATVADALRRVHPQTPPVHA